MSLALLGRGNLGIRSRLGVDESVGINALGIVSPRITVSSLTSTLTASAASFVAGSAGVTLTFTARDASNATIEGYVPVPESGVV